jgi:hypothetical protein
LPHARQRERVTRILLGCGDHFPDEPINDPFRIFEAGTAKATRLTTRHVMVGMARVPGGFVTVARVKSVRREGRRRAGGLAHGASYVEKRCALRWPLVTWGLGLPAALITGFLVLAVLINPQWIIAAAFTPLFLPFMIGTALLYRNWPTEIRVDRTGLSIGAVGSQRASARRPSVAHQNWGLFSCTWPAVISAAVVTDPARIREIKRSPSYWTLSNRWGKPRAMTQCMAGVLTAPFMKAALVIHIDHDEAGVIIPELRSSLFFSNYIAEPTFATRLNAEPSLEWVVPTRHPDELRAFLASIGR